MADKTVKGVVIVTGAAQGIGLGIAIRLAQDGFNLVMNDISNNKEALEKAKDDISLKATGEVLIFDWQLIIQ